MKSSGSVPKWDFGFTMTCHGQLSFSDNYAAKTG